MCFCPEQSESDLESERLDVVVQSTGELSWDYWYCTFPDGSCGGP
jgi:hypothetical protein